VIKKIDHIGFFVKDIEQAKDKFSNGLGLKLVREEVFDSLSIKIAFFQCGNILLELLEPYRPGEAMDLLEKYGGGIHHICYEVADIDEAIKKFSEEFILRDKEPKPGAGGSKVFFLESKSIFNIESEFVELPK